MNILVSLDSFFTIICKSNISSLKVFKLETVNVILACYDDQRILAHKLYLHSMSCSKSSRGFQISAFESLLASHVDGELKGRSRVHRPWSGARTPMGMRFVN